MLKKLIILIAFLLCFSVCLISISGCAQKKAEQETEEVTEAQVDTTEAAAEDTTVAE